MRVAIYARVSTDDKGQDPENQLRELRAWCTNSGHAIFREYVEREVAGRVPTGVSNSQLCSTSERTKAGMARAKANGIKIGRPKLGVEIRQKIAQRAKKGETPYAIAKVLGIDRHTAAKYALNRSYCD